MNSGTGFLIILLVLYFLPAIVAELRGHRNMMAIWIINIFLGWTGIGWVIALVMAVWRERRVA